MGQRYCYLIRRCYGQCSCWQFSFACQSIQDQARSWWMAWCCCSWTWQSRSCPTCSWRWRWLRAKHSWICWGLLRWADSLVLSKLASVMLLNSLAATLVLVGTFHDWTWRLVNLLTTSMYGVSTVKPSNSKFGNNLRSLILSMCWSRILKPNSWKYSVYKFCLGVMTWQLDRGKGFLVITPPDSGFAQFLTWKRNIKRIESNITLVVSMSTWPITVDVILLSKTCVCTTITKMILNWWYLSMPSAEKGGFGQIHSGRFYHHVCVHSLRTSRNLFHGKTWQNFLFEDLLNHHDDGALCGASMFLDRGAGCSCLLQGLHHVGTPIPVPLKHILPQRFTAQLPLQTFRQIDQFAKEYRG